MPFLFIWQYRSAKDILHYQILLLYLSDYTFVL